MDKSKEIKQIKMVKARKQKNANFMCNIMAMSKEIKSIKTQQFRGKNKKH